MPDDDRDATAETAKLPVPVIQAEALFGDNREIWIEYHGERYRMRITRRGKLILQK